MIAAAPQSAYDELKTSIPSAKIDAHFQFQLKSGS
jgi:hypothetical protein